MSLDYRYQDVCADMDIIRTDSLNYNGSLLKHFHEKTQSGYSLDDDCYRIIIGIDINNDVLIMYIPIVERIVDGPPSNTRFVKFHRPTLQNRSK